MLGPKPSRPFGRLYQLAPNSRMLRTSRDLVIVSILYLRITHAAQQAERYRIGDLLLQDAIMDYRASKRVPSDEQTFGPLGIRRKGFWKAEWQRRPVAPLKPNATGAENTNPKPTSDVAGQLRTTINRLLLPNRSLLTRQIRQMIILPPATDLIGTESL